MSRFLDISNYNSVNNYGAVANAGLSVICKASEGTTLQESSFNSKYNNLKSVGVRVGAYHMLCVTSEPETQAQNFANMISGKELDIYPVLDVEYDNLRRCAEEYSNRFIAKFKELTGLDMIVYSCESYLNDCFSDAFRNSHALWVANYGSNPENRLPNVIAWQFTDKCRDYGFVDGDVDCNELLDANRFFINGSITFNCSFAAPQKVQSNNVVLQLQQLINAQGFGPVAEDGIAGPDTLSHCPMVKEGASGQITQWVQLRVGANADGDFGPNTEQAVKWFQQSRGLSADGIVGEDTWHELLSM